MRLRQIALAGLAALSAVEPALARDVAIAWASAYLDERGPGPSSTAGRATGMPDGQFVGPLGALDYIWLSRFDMVTRLEDLNVLLGVPEETLARADIIVFDSNMAVGVCGLGFEGSIWFFSDGRGAYAEVFDEATQTGTVGHAGFTMGEVPSGDFETYFGLVPTAIPNFVNWLLIDVPDYIDVRAARVAPHDPGFSLWVGGAFQYVEGLHHGLVAGLPVPCRYEGAPGIDAVGIILHD